MRTLLTALLILIPSSALACESSVKTDHINRTTEVVRCPENVLPKIIGDRVPQQVAADSPAPVAKKKSTASKKKRKPSASVKCKKGQRKIKHWRGKKVWYTCR